MDAVCLAIILAISTMAWLSGPVQAGGPKVVLIVGPVGEHTASYRSFADAGAAEARRVTPNVVTIYSPDATWPAVRSALQGASLVVYLGHGNGWPSPYSDSLVPAHQDGLGLNPVAGVNDTAHQYFGEAYLAREVKLAPHAIVLLHHLCYASGASEPGLPEDGLPIAEQRVDNFAAGWIAAGADAVLADAFFGPAYYVRSILSGGASVDSIWKSAPSFHDNVVTFPSLRSPGFVGELDPTSPGNGFHRSLVARPGSRTSAVADAVSPAPSSEVPTAASGPIAIRVTLGATPVAGTKVPLVVTLAAPDASVAPSSIPGAAAASSPSPSAVGTRLGVQWTPLALDPLPEVAPAPNDPAASPTPSATPSPSPSAAPTEPVSAASPSPSAAPSPSPSAAPTEPASATTPAPAAPTTTPAPAAPTTTPAPAAPTTTPAPAVPASGSSPPPDAALASLVSVETPGDLVVLADTKVRGAGLTAQVAVPDRPGLYRLVMTLHDATGVAFDVATQRRVPVLHVRVTASLSAVIVAPSSLSVIAGASTTLALSVANAGSLAWQQSSWANRRADGGSAPESRDPIVLGHWLSLASSTTETPSPPRVSVSAAPGTAAAASLPLVAPSVAGEYLLVLDVVSPVHGSLTASGSAAAVVRVTVVAAPDCGLFGIDSSGRTCRDRTMLPGVGVIPSPGASASPTAGRSPADVSSPGPSASPTPRPVSR